MKTGLIYWSREPWWERHCLGRESAQPGVFADIWKELWKSPQIQWFPVKHFLTHHLEFDYEVNRLEFCTRDVIFPLPLVSSAIKTCLSALSNDNDKCSRGKRCHEKHTKDFSEGKKRTSTPRWTLFQRRNYAQWESKKWNACCPAEALIDRDLQGLRDLAISVDFSPDKERLLEKKKTRIWIVSADYPWSSEISVWMWNILSLWLMLHRKIATQMKVEGACLQMCVIQQANCKY